MARMAVSLLAILVLGASRASFAIPPDACAQPTANEIRAAMLSVYYHAYAPFHEEIGWKPLPLLDATRILGCDQSFGASVRRRRAIIKLAPSTILTRGASGQARTLAVVIGAALDQLGVPVEKLTDHLRTQDQQDIVPLERATTEFLQATTGPWSRLCCSRVTFCDVHAPATAADLGAVFFSIDVERPQVDVKLAMDPQSWASCEGTYFADTHRIGDTCPTQAPTGTPAPAPKTAGSTWTGALFEHFEANFKGGNKALFKNLLNIDAKDSTTSFRFDYGLCTPFGSLESDVLGKKATPGALLEDCGFAQVSDSTSTSSLVSGIKALRFAPLPGVSGLGAWLHLSLEYLVDQIADVGVCCGVEGVEPPICDYVDQDCRQAPRSKTQTGWPKTPLCK